MLKPIKIYILKLLNSKRCLNNYYYSSIRITILNKIQSSDLRVLRINNFNDILPYQKILEGYHYKSSTQKNLEIKVPDLKLFKFTDVFLNSFSSAIIKDKNIFYEAINDNERFNEGFIKYHSKKNAIVDLTGSTEIEEGFFLAGNGSFNWYHWMIEILPKMLYYKEILSKIILVDNSCKTIPTMAESLRIVTEKLNVKIIYLDKNKSYKVKNLYFINEVNKLMFNPIDPNKNTLPLYYFRQESLKLLNEKFRSNYFENKEENKKIFLDRKNTHRIAKNENEIRELLQHQNFHNIDGSKLNFSEQINTFSNAEVIVGTTGAAFTNIIFCKPKCKIIIFIPQNYRYYKFYREIGEMLDLKLSYLYYDNDDADHTKSDFIIDTNELDRLLKI